MVNGERRELKTFRKQSVYITQQDYLLQDLTVYEYMMSAAHLKLGNKVSDKQKKSEVISIDVVLLITAPKICRDRSI